MKHEELLKLLITASEATEENCPMLFDVTDPKRPMPVLIKNFLNESVFELFAASPFLYQSLFTSLAMIEAAILHLETYAPNVSQEIIIALEQQSKAALMAMRVATEGVDKVLKESAAENVLNTRKNI